ncbi:hypothetical protein JG688_00001254 [Phytophthora aleatoria]|uniref:Crinkler (CRN) family protein n=1 Tax=Phytophthora aleatoria TaxID=2496075 RepID=A0A8J5MIA7_9STRA|nr:hypothetical protein JG688_00001254 [Phytophthora aleatoria]
MAGFPTLAQLDRDRPAILERSCYRVIFDGLMGKVKKYLGKKGLNLAVVGNPGIGKSRFYLYCAFRLIHGLVDEEMKSCTYTLVLNFKGLYHVYSWSEKAFILLNTEEGFRLRENHYVLRLLEADSTDLLGWAGVSIAFTSPALEKLNSFLKVAMSCSFISPVWSLSELQACNAILDDGLKLTNDELVSRYTEYGGIPRSIFDGDQDSALRYGECDWGIQSRYSHVNNCAPVRESNLSHYIIAMVPTTSNFEPGHEYVFISKSIAEKSSIVLANIQSVRSANLHVAIKNVVLLY